MSYVQSAKIPPKLSVVMTRFSNRRPANASKDVPTLDRQTGTPVLVMFPAFLILLQALSQ